MLYSPTSGVTSTDRKGGQSGTTRAGGKNCEAIFSSRCRAFHHIWDDSRNIKRKCPQFSYLLYSSKTPKVLLNVLNYQVLWRIYVLLNGKSLPRKL